MLPEIECTEILDISEKLAKEDWYTFLALLTLFALCAYYPDQPHLQKVIISQQLSIPLASKVPKLRQACQDLQESEIKLYDQSTRATMNLLFLALGLPEIKDCGDARQ